MAFRDELSAARAKAEALERRVRDLEEELARAKGESPQAETQEIEAEIEKVRAEAQRAAAKALETPRTFDFGALLSWTWFVLRIGFRLAVMAVGGLSIGAGVSEREEAASYRPPVVRRVSADALPPWSEVQGRPVVIADSVCLLSKLTYLGSMSGESNPPCYFPVVSRESWAAQRAAGRTAPAFADVRVVVERWCSDIEKKFGPVLVARAQTPRRCSMDGTFVSLRRQEPEVQRLLRAQYPGLRDGVRVLEDWNEKRPSAGFGSFLVVIGAALALWMLARIVQTIRKGPYG